MAVGAIIALIRRDYLERRTFRFALALDLMFGMLNLVVYFYISHVLRHPAHGLPHGEHSYFSFAAVGVAFMLVIQAATATLARRVREDELTGTLEAICAQPVSPWAMAFGLSGFPYLFAVIRASGYLVVADLLLHLGITHPAPLGIAATLFVSGMALMAVGIVLAAVVVALGTGAQLVSVVVFGLGFLGGAYFPIGLLPAPLRELSLLTPTRYALQAMRDALYGGHWPASFWPLLGLAVVALPISLLVFRLALGVSAGRGTLTRG